MLEAVARVLVWLGLGEILMRLGVLPVPGPVTGLVLLYTDLTWHGRLPDDLGQLADRLLGLFGLLFVPAGVGLVAHADVLRAEAVPILAAIIGGTVVTLLASIAAATLFRSFTNRRVRQITTPIDGEPATAANGGTIGIAAASRDYVLAWHEAGPAHGGTAIESQPTERPNGSFVAYLRDPDGNKLTARTQPTK